MITFSFPLLREALGEKKFLIFFLRIHPVEAEPLSASYGARYSLLDNYSRDLLDWLVMRVSALAILRNRRMRGE
jgi:hypothetical protein